MSHTAREIAATVRAAVGTEPDLSIRLLPSGATAVDLRANGRAVVIDGASDGQWGVSRDLDSAGGFGGYEQVFASLADAAAAAHSLLVAP